MYNKPRAMGSLDGFTRHVVNGRKSPFEYAFTPDNEEIADRVIQFIKEQDLHIAFYDRFKTRLIHIDNDNEREKNLPGERPLMELALAILNQSNIWFDSEEDMNFFLINFSENFKVA